MSGGHRGFWPREPWVVGHRGAPRHGVENTLQSFEAAIAAGADMVELDVRRSRDGVLFVYHGPTLPTGSRLLRVPIRSLTYAQICAILSRMPTTRHRGRLSGGAAPPRFDDVVKRIGSRIKINAEIKGTGYEEEVIDVLRRHALPDAYVITSFKLGVVRRVKSIAPDIRVGLVMGARAAPGRFGVAAFRRAARCGADFLVAHTGFAGPSFLDEAARRRMPVIIYAWPSGMLNRPEKLARYVNDHRIAGIITDVPDIAVAARKGRGGVS